MTTPGPDWVEQARRFAAGLAAEHAGAGLSDALGSLLGHPDADRTRTDPAGECRRCPLCAGLAALRGRRPDLLEALADVLTSAATVLRTTAHTTGAHTTPDGSDAVPPVPGPTAPPEETVPQPTPTPTVQRIDVA